MPAPALVAVAHGSRDPRSAATIDALAAEVRRQRPALDVRVSFLDLSAPRLPDVLDGVAADGHRHVVVVPLLLGNAFHARSDVPGLVSAAARRHPRLAIDTADVLGGDAGTDAAALWRLRDALVADGSRSACGDPLHDPELGVVLASVGSTRAEANRAVADRAERWRARFGWAAAGAAYVTAAEPTPAQAIDAVRAAGARRVAVVPWVLAPGRLPDRIDAAAADGGALVADPIGPHPDLAAAVLRRWADAAAPAAGVRQVG
jgi:sirohydrochlorin ferrochelatase